MKNRFYSAAIAHATRLIGKPGRLISLVGQLVARLKTSDKGHQIGELKEGLQTTGRLIAAYARGHYRNVSATIILKLVAAVLYFINPFDLIPDAIIGLGLADDLAIVTWVLRSANKEIRQFKTWEAEDRATIT